MLTPEGTRMTERHPRQPMRGWKRRSDLNVYDLSPDHPAYPPEWQSEDPRKVRERLAGDPAVEAVVALLQSELREEITTLGDIAGDLPTIEEMRQFGDQQPFQGLILYLTQISRRIYQRAARAPIRDVPIENVVAYLAERTLPAPVVRYWERNPARGGIIAHADPDAGPVIMMLYPGEVAIKIAGGMPIKDVSGKLSKVIQDAQALTGQQKRRGAGVKIENNKQRSSLARKVARMRTERRPDEEIADAVRREFARVGVAVPPGGAKLAAFLDRYEAAGKVAVERDHGRTAEQHPTGN